MTSLCSTASLQKLVRNARQNKKGCGKLTQDGWGLRIGLETRDEFQPEQKHRPLGWPVVLTVHPDPALLLAHGLQKDPIQHATSHGPTDWDNRFQLLRG